MPCQPASIVITARPGSMSRVSSRRPGPARRVRPVPAAFDRNPREPGLDAAVSDPPHRLGERNDTVTRFEQPLHARAECLRAPHAPPLERLLLPAPPAAGQGD